MIPLYKPYMPDDLTGLYELLKSGGLGYGKWSREFEAKLCSFINTDLLITTNSYSNAIQIALSTLGLNYGDEVIASPVACLASNMPLVTYGLKVVWADIDPKTGTLDPESVKKVISDRTKLIFHNHFCGYVGYVDEINEIGKEFGIPVIDDCVEAFGSKYKGNRTGNIGTNITVFSFQTVRLPNTIDGGAIVFSDKKLYDLALLKRDFGIDRSIFRDENNEISSKCDIAMPGYGAMMSDVNSFVGCKQMADIDSLLKVQKNNAEQWNLEFEDFSHDLYGLTRSDIQPNYWVFGLLTNKKYEKMRMFKDKGYYASGVHLNNNNYSVFGDNSCMIGVNEFMSKFLAIPCGWWFDKGNKDEI